MAIANRLKRLENAVAGNGDPGQRIFEQFMAEHGALRVWLKERGYPDHLAAVEAGESGPEGLQELLTEYARYDVKHRAWARIEAALHAHQLPAQADVDLMTGRRIE